MNRELEFEAHFVARIKRECCGGGGKGGGGSGFQGLADALNQQNAKSAAVAPPAPAQPNDIKPSLVPEPATERATKAAAKGATGDLFTDAQVNSVGGGTKALLG